MPMSLILEKSFYNDYTPKVARRLLGCGLVREMEGKTYKGVITETESYRGFHDLASHASGGQTERNKAMFGHPGIAYIYLVYGMHWMLNVVTEEEGYPAAVLIRGVDLVDENRNIIEKLDGPGKLTRKMEINKTLNELDLTKREKLWIEKNRFSPKKRVIKSSRIGVDYAKHCKKWKWNFKIKL